MACLHAIFVFICIFSMRFRIVYFLCLLATVSFFVSCSFEKDASDIVVFIKNEVPDTLTVGKYVPLDIFAITPNEYIKEISISTFDPDNGEVLNHVEVLDARVQEYQFEYLYQVPLVSSKSAEIKIYVDASDNLGNRTRFTLRRQVQGAYLKELSGLEFYNPLTENNDGFNTNAKSTVRKAMLAMDDEPVSFWLRQFTDEEKLLSPENLPMEWNTCITGSRVTFARSNSFNYADATSFALEAAYSSMKTDNYVSQIKQGDIILVGVDNKAWGAVLVLYVIDAPGVDDDRMIVNIKTIN